MSDMTLAQAKRMVERAKAAEDKDLAEKTRANALKLVGKCFVYQNGGGGKSWPLYIKVLAVRSVWTYIASLWVEAVEASRVDMYGTGVQRNGRYDAYHGVLDASYSPISEDEYDRRTNAILAELGLRRARNVTR